jgi:hypothetical protein
VHKRHLLAVESPSRKDVEKGIHFLTDEINQPGLDPNGRSDQMREEWEKDREAMKEYLNNSGNLFAEVFALSGLRVAPFTEDASKLSIRDWALVRPNADNSMGKNDVSAPLCCYPNATDAGIDWDRNNTGWQRTRPPLPPSPHHRPVSPDNRPKQFQCQMEIRQSQSIPHF